MKVNSTEKAVKKIIMSADCGISEEEAAKRFEELEYLKLPPREQEENKLVLFRAEELYEELIGMEREAFGQHISMFEAVLNNGEPEEIDMAREHMKEIIQMFQRVSF